MSTITREQAQKIIEAADEVITALAGTNEDIHSDSDNMLRLWDDLNDRYAPQEVVRELARIALASLEAKPIGAFHIADQQVGGTTDYIKDGEWPIDDGVIEVYAAPPAPVSVPDQWSKSLQEMVDAMRQYEMDVDEDAPHKHRAMMRRAEELLANRAAMLQGAEAVTTDYKLHDGWVACSELMPEQFKAILAFNEYGEVWSGAYDRYWNFYCDNLLVEHVTHWMPLPAAPQQEV